MTGGGDANDGDDHSSTNSSGWTISNRSALRILQEEQLAQDFRTTLWRHVQSLRRQDGVDLYPNEEESRLLRSVVATHIGWWQGALTGVVILGTLRMGPMHLARFLQQQKSKSTSISSPFSKMKPISDLKQNETGFLYAFWWTLDLGISVFAAANVAFFYTDYHGIYQDLSRIPLLPGTSSLCHHVCPVAMQTMQRYQDDPSTAPLLHKPVTPAFQSWQAMVRNCQRRSAFANTQRRLNSMPNADQIIKVPSPQGVPLDIQYLPLKQDEHGDVYNLRVWNTPRQEETSLDHGE